jgi:hypothetical protein
MSDEAETTRQLLDDDSGPCPSLPPASFDLLVYSLRMQAEVNLGMLPPEVVDDNYQGPDLEAAHHYIDLLAVLQEKTRGNLTADEQQALDNAIAEMRFGFVEAMKRLPFA